ncbi:MAG: hypothetical protein JSV03_14460 [Planctomycetota bacterium]|nr:MAG: hypothetical protein JSV03_14460 [Planctomycetota bacterium]
MPRRDFLKGSVATVGAIGAVGATGCQTTEQKYCQVSTVGYGFGGSANMPAKGEKKYNSVYTGDQLNRVAFPMGGMGAGMICLEGTGALSHFSLRNQPDVFNEPCVFAAVCVKGKKKEQNIARVLEGPVPGWKLFGQPGSGNGGKGNTFGLPRFRQVSFETRFPFGTVSLKDEKVPLDVEITGWSPFVPGDPDSSSLPVAALEYRFKNPTDKSINAVWSFNAKNFMAITKKDHNVRATDNGFVLEEKGSKGKPWEQGSFSATVDAVNTKVNCAWFRGGWFDSLTMAWKYIQDGACYEKAPVPGGGPATIFVPFELAPGKEKTITLHFAWYVGKSNVRTGRNVKKPPAVPGGYRPWYAERFKDIDDVTLFWRSHYGRLRANTKQFSDCFYDSTLPPEVLEAVAANLSILKSPTVLRERKGRLWCYEGCRDNAGCCHGSCTHVWNYAQAIPHLFPSLERTLRETEFFVSQDEKGHQTFRSSLPIRPPTHSFHAACDGQLGGIMKTYREWRIGGDRKWLAKIWPNVKASLHYCIETWDPKHKGILEEPHHNTYDIEFWGPDGMCTSFYLGALSAAIKMGEALKDDVSFFKTLLDKGTKYTEKELFDGEYFYQKIQWEGLKAQNPLKVKSMVGNYSPEAQELLKKEGPKYQYGIGFISDGVLGSWLAAVCGVGQVLNKDKVASHLKSVHKYNLKTDLSDHANPQRPTYACGSEGGLLLCTWPKGGQLSLPFVYSNEVWTGIEYQVASHLMLMGIVEEGLEIVRVCRDRYDGRIRNPFNEYECGHWYARAMSSYGLLQGLTGARYDAVEKVLYLEPNIKGDFHSFLSTATGYGTVGVKNGKPFVKVKSGEINIREIKYIAKV